MAITKEHIRFSIHFAFHLKKNAAEATAMICAAYGENAAIKSGFFMITLNVENHGLTLVNLQHRRQSPISTPRRFCSVSGRIGKMCYELLQPSETITADCYQQQLTNLSEH
ncbi:hypothetical protein P5V15_001016 [Pogonomyrmex californicus]